MAANNLYGVRQKMIEMGLDNSKIGWDQTNKAVTYDGKFFLNPDKIGTDSRAYVSPDNFDKAYKALGLAPKPVVNPQPAQPAQPDPVSELLSKLSQKLDTPYQHQEDPRISEIIDKLNKRLKGSFNYDVESDPAYQAASRIVGRNAEVASRQAQEELNSRGILNSTITSDRLGQIQQDAMGTLDQLIPELQQNAFTRDQAFVSGLYNLLSVLVGKDSSDRQMGLNEYNSGLQGLGNLVNLTQGKIDSDRGYNLEAQKLEIARQQSELDAALSRAARFGRVTTAADAAILGVPVGTSTLEAQEAVANRQHDLEVQANQLEAQERMNQANIASRESIAAKDRALQWSRINQQNTLEDFSKDMQIWQATGKAPDSAAMKHYGIEPGTEWSTLPPEKLNNLKAALEQEEIEATIEMTSKLPLIQAAYGVDQLTATAIYGAWENPTLESAIADFRANQAALSQQGVNTDVLWRVINSTWNPQTKQWVLPDLSSPTETKPSTSPTRDFMNWSIGGP